MIYSYLTKKAMRIAYEAHKNQVDKGGIPYIYHSSHMAEQMQSEDEICVALLHDVLEDSDVSLDELQREGFGTEVIEALKLLTHERNVPYMEYIENIKSNPIAVKVKLADLKHNSDITRLNEVDDKVLERIEKYRRAIDLLSN